MNASFDQKYLMKIFKEKLKCIWIINTLHFFRYKSLKFLEHEEDKNIAIKLL